MRLVRLLMKRAVVDRLLPTAIRLAMPIVPLAPSEHAVSVRVGELAIEIIDLRLELGDASL